MIKFAILGNHLPRHCGIATFTTHLADALDQEAPDGNGFVVAMNDAGRHHAYPPRVHFAVSEGDLSSYRRAADFLNVNHVDVLSVQHEYGIFGGKAGAYVLTLLRELRMPIVTTLHTVLSTPSPAQRAAMDELAQLSTRLVLMSTSGADLLMRVHGIRHDQIDLIPHGIPDVPVDPSSKERLGVGGKTVIMTFGLLSRDKGIEYVIDALPEILSAHPETVYIILGATHPHVVEHEGETYRLMLETRAKHLGVADHLIFHNRFVSQAELTEYLSAADIYITPYLQPEQITSGTLAYASGAGKCTISTPYTYARELLDDGRGVLVPYRDSSAVAREMIALLDNDETRRQMSARALAHGASMTWPSVSCLYLQSFRQALEQHGLRRRRAFRAQTLAERHAGLPEITLKHVRTMTDDTGMLQHALFSVPRYADGYCVDDNARALLLMALLEDAGGSDPDVVRMLGSRYLAFVSYAFDRPSGRFRNFLSYGRQWLETCGSEDSHGRAVWALGAAVGRASDPGRQSLASDVFHSALPALAVFTSPRAWAYGLLGIDEYLRAFQGDNTVEARRGDLAGRLLGLLARTSRKDWCWFEDSVTYCNARLPQALIVSGHRMQRSDMTEAGFRSLEWLMSVQSSPERQFAGVGSNGFYVRGAPRAPFDQQPVEAGGTVSACLDAYEISRDNRWSAYARSAFDWFLGENHLQQWLFDPSTGGCRDGLHVDRANLNQGAEATLSFLLALQGMRSAEAHASPNNPTQLPLEST